MYTITEFRSVALAPLFVAEVPTIQAAEEWLRACYGEISFSKDGSDCADILTPAGRHFMIDRSGTMRIKGN